MHAAPAVSFDADDGGCWRAAVAGLVALVAGVLAAWLLGWGVARLGDPSAPVHALPALAGLAAAAAAGMWAWHRGGRPPPRLAWDTRAWRLQAPGQAPVTGQLHVVADLGGWMLLAFAPASADGAPEAEGRAAGRPWARAPGGRWIAVGARAVAPARAALYAASQAGTAA